MLIAYRCLMGNIRVYLKEKPDYIVPEVEAISTDTLLELERDGFNVVPTAKATKLTMNRVLDV